MKSADHPPVGIDATCRFVASHYAGNRGIWAYQAFDYINTTFFDDHLPTPLIVWALTPHGSCLGYTSTKSAIIVLHPSLLGGTEKDDPWGYPPELLGPPFAFDTVLHECMHLHIEHCLGGWSGKGTSSHNNDLWVNEVNRIAPLISLDIKAERSKTKRVPIDGEPTKRGKQPTKVIRASGSTVPFDAIAKFPRAVRLHLGQTQWYLDKKLPFPHALEK
jgi:hypothetical protein